MEAPEWYKIEQWMRGKARSSAGVVRIFEQGLGRYIIMGHLYAIHIFINGLTSFHITLSMLWNFISFLDAISLVISFIWIVFDFISIFDIF